MSDSIDRQAAINTLAEMHCKSDEDGYVWIIRSDAWSRIDALPSAEPKRGKWLRSGSDLFPYECDLCGETNERTTPWCPNCGADMRGEE